MAQQEKSKNEPLNEEVEDITPRLTSFYFQTGKGEIIRIKAKSFEEAEKKKEKIGEVGDEAGEIFAVKTLNNKVLVNPFIINPRIHGGSDIDLEVVNLRNRLHLKPLPNPPDNPVKGDIYFNTNGHPYSYDGSSWHRMDYEG